MTLAPGAQALHQAGALQQGQVLGHRLPAHAQPFGKRVQRLPVTGVQAVDQATAAGVAESAEYEVVVHGRGGCAATAGRHARHNVGNRRVSGQARPAGQTFAPSSMVPPPTRTDFAHGPAGRIELLLDAPVGAPRGVGIVAHPHPLMGASARHKVPHVLAHALRDQGWLAVRPNFRGVGRSEGRHDEGAGETSDLFELAGQLRSEHPGLPLALMGFSFGAYVQSHVAARLAAAGAPARHVLLAGMPVGQVRDSLDYQPAAVDGAWLVHGEQDERAGLQPLLDWARPRSHPVFVVPGADHFFTGRLHLLRECVAAQLGGV